MGAYEFITPVPSDFNDDGNVDADDLETFLSCDSGPAIPFTGDCGKADLDRDNDVDQVDFGVFQRCFSENQPANAACAN